MLFCNPDKISKCNLQSAVNNLIGIVGLTSLDLGLSFYLEVNAVTKMQPMSNLLHIHAHNVRTHLTKAINT